MSDFKRVMSGKQKRSPRNIDTFSGSHYGTGRTDQSQEFGYVCDFDIVNRKLELRDGKRRNQLWGYSAKITAVLDVHIGGLNLVGHVQNGVLSLYPVSDMLLQIRRYYTWAEVERRFTWDELADKTWEELRTGSDREGS